MQSHRWMCKGQLEAQLFESQQRQSSWLNFLKMSPLKLPSLNPFRFPPPCLRNYIPKQSKHKWLTTYHHQQETAYILVISRIHGEIDHEARTTDVVRRERNHEILSIEASVSVRSSWFSSIFPWTQTYDCHRQRYFSTGTRTMAD